MINYTHLTELQNLIRARKFEEFTQALPADIEEVKKYLTHTSDQSGKAVLSLIMLLVIYGAVDTLSTLNEKSKEYIDQYLTSSTTYCAYSIRDNLFTYNGEVGCLFTAVLNGQPEMTRFLLNLKFNPNYSMKFKLIKNQRVVESEYPNSVKLTALSPWILIKSADFQKVWEAVCVIFETHSETQEQFLDGLVELARYLHSSKQPLDQNHKHLLKDGDPLSFLASIIEKFKAINSSKTKPFDRILKNGIDYLEWTYNLLRKIGANKHISIPEEYPVEHLRKSYRHFNLHECFEADRCYISAASILIPAFEHDAIQQYQPSNNTTAEATCQEMVKQLLPAHLELVLKAAYQHISNYGNKDAKVKARSALGLLSSTTPAEVFQSLNGFHLKKKEVPFHHHLGRAAKDLWEKQQAFEGSTVITPEYIFKTFQFSSQKEQNIEGTFELACCYRDEFGVRKDREKAGALFFANAQQHHHQPSGDALLTLTADLSKEFLSSYLPLILGWLDNFLKIKNITVQQQEQAVSQLTALANEKHCPEARVILGQYSAGMQKYQEAAQWLTQSAEMLPIAAYELACLYKDNRVRLNPIEASELTATYLYKTAELISCVSEKSRSPEDKKLFQKALEELKGRADMGFPPALWWYGHAIENKLVNPTALVGFFNKNSNQSLAQQYKNRAMSAKDDAYTRPEMQTTLEETHIDDFELISTSRIGDRVYQFLFTYANDSQKARENFTRTLEDSKLSADDVTFLINFASLPIIDSFARIDLLESLTQVKDLAETDQARIVQAKEAISLPQFAYVPPEANAPPEDDHVNNFSK